MPTSVKDNIENIQEKCHACSTIFVGLDVFLVGYFEVNIKHMRRKMSLNVCMLLSRNTQGLKKRRPDHCTKMLTSLKLDLEFHYATVFDFG
jgi:hypothetical protein